jgi:hypothetical protein
MRRIRSLFCELWAGARARARACISMHVDVRVRVCVHKFVPFIGEATYTLTTHTHARVSACMLRVQWISRRNFCMRVQTNVAIVGPHTERMI